MLWKYPLFSSIVPGTIGGLPIRRRGTIEKRGTVGEGGTVGRLKGLTLSTKNIDNSKVANSMTCFSDGSQLHDYVDAFKAALNGA